MFMVMALHLQIYRVLEPSVCDYVLSYAIPIIAIPLFFMVSGYLMCNKKLTWDYTIYKIKGILRFIFITCSIYIVLIAISEFMGLHYAWSDNLILSYFSWFIQKGAVWQYWYFGAMIILYLMMPLLGKLINTRYMNPALLSLIALSLIMFTLDCTHLVEPNQTVQTFRLWYWLMFFLLGAYINKHRDQFKRFNWKWAVVACVVYVAFQRAMQLYLSTRIGYLKNEYFFGSGLCMVYAVCVFCACINANIANNKVISTLSSLFLPVYAFHILFFHYFKQLAPYITGVEPNLDYVILYLVYTSLTIGICWLLMKIPAFRNMCKI